MNYILNKKNFNFSEIPFIESQVHTNWTDGKNSIQQMFEKAQGLGVEVLIFSEHSSEKNSEWFEDFAAIVRNLTPSKLKVYLGTEVRVKNFDGDLAINDNVRRQVDLVLGSVHRFPDKNGNTLNFSEINKYNALNFELELMISAVKKQEIHILAHPFGMSIFRFGIKPTSDDWYDLLSVVRENGICIELNSKYHERYLKEILELFLKFGINFTIGSDAHETSQVGDCYFKIKKFTNI